MSSPDPMPIHDMEADLIMAAFCAHEVDGGASSLFCQRPFSIFEPSSDIPKDKLNWFLNELNRWSQRLVRADATRLYGYINMEIDGIKYSQFAYTAPFYLVTENDERLVRSDSVGHTSNKFDGKLYTGAFGKYLLAVIVKSDPQTNREIAHLGLFSWHPFSLISVSRFIVPSPEEAKKYLEYINNLWVRERNIQEFKLKQAEQEARASRPAREREEREKAVIAKRQADEAARVQAELNANALARQREEAAETAFWNSPEGRQVRAAQELAKLEDENRRKAMELDLEKERKLAEIRRQALEEEMRITEELQNKMRNS